MESREALAREPVDHFSVMILLGLKCKACPYFQDLSGEPRTG